MYINTTPPTNRKQQMFQVINTKTGQVVATCRTKSGAEAKRDQRDGSYGSAVHKVVQIA